MIGVSTIEAKLTELDRLEEQWMTERTELLTKISALKQGQEEWPEVKANLLAKLHSLQAQAAEADKLALLMLNSSNEKSTDSPSSSALASSPTSPSHRQPLSVTAPQASPVSAPSSTPSTPSKPTAKKSKTTKKRKKPVHKAAAAPPPPAESTTTAIDSTVTFDYAPKFTLSFHLDSIRCLAFHPTLPYLASGSDDGTIRITNLETKRVKGRRNPIQFLSLRGHSSPILSLAVRGNVLISGDVDGGISVWEFGEMKSTLYETHGRVDHHQIFHSHLHNDAIWSIAAHEKSSFFVTASSDQSVRTYDCNTYESTSISTPSIPCSVVFINDGQLFVVGCIDGTILVYNSKLELQSTFNCGSRIISMCTFNTPSNILVACEDKNVKLMDVMTKEEKKSFVGHEDFVSSITMLNNGCFFATTSADKTVRAWRSQTFEIVYAEAHHRDKYGEGGLCVASTPASNPHQFFASSGAEGTVKVFALK
ncbi:striatin-4 isoform X1 [Histomonas meleagridis]|uniref:striatin-4 isoform X1 n=1 Tax=Histomonas meleagridis TaxID=135588 RepID=UPI00355A966C|nr:striatin-4 isoform X1 [Histomonas meleagridis]KAH0797212.1 striatin-4 isoform X1 [Histomonas meleagridis]